MAGRGGCVSEIGSDIAVVEATCRLLDAALPGPAGRSPHRPWRFLSTTERLRVMLVTAHDDPELAEQGYAAGALAFVPKIPAARPGPLGAHGAARGAIPAPSAGG